MGNPLEKIGAVFDFPWVIDEIKPIWKKTISLDLLEEVLGKIRSYAPKWSDGANGGLPW